MPGDAFGLAAEGHEGRAGVRGSRHCWTNRFVRLPHSNGSLRVEHPELRQPPKNVLLHTDVMRGIQPIALDTMSVTDPRATCCRMPGSPPTAQITNPYSHAPHQRQVERWTLVGTARTSHSCQRPTSRSDQVLTNGNEFSPSLWPSETSERDLCRAELRAVS